MSRFILLLLGCLWLVPAQAISSPELPAAVISALKSVGISPSHVGVVVWEAGKSEPRLAHKEKSSFNPASVMKLLTTYAGLDLLGPAYTWKNEVYVDGPIVKGVLDGNLYIKGYGDPYLTLERFWLLLRELKLRGIDDIRGDVILDASYFPGDAPDPASFDGDPRRAYNAPPSALLVNFNSTTLRLATDSGVFLVNADPLPVPLILENHIQIGSGSCNDWRDHLAMEYQKNNGTPRLVLTGTYALSCGEKTTEVNLGDPLDTTAGLFRALWAEQSGKLRGAVHAGLVPPAARLFEQFDSPPLAEVLRSINKWSNNVMARHLFLTLGAEGKGPPARLDKSIAVMRGWLKAKGIDTSGVVLENGAGLSRIERIRPINLAKLLQDAWQSPLSSELESSLPIVAVDGTMKSRGKDDDVAGHAHIKTGTLAGAKNLAGYLVDRNGRRWIVVFFINDLNAERGTDAQDALLEWVYQGAGIRNQRTERSADPP
ncbi:MAG: D-alanyl-D-alanine carboxypeptidase/D-alanyl-D-alanine-endopeptidase [Thiobacillaceae bacterium]